jgi:hypothetical protein
MLLERNNNIIIGASSWVSDAVLFSEKPGFVIFDFFLFLLQDMKERISENPLAYTGNTLHFELSQEEIEKNKKKD